MFENKILVVVIALTVLVIINIICSIRKYMFVVVIAVTAIVIINIMNNVGK